MSVTVTTAGFTLHASDGEIVAYAEHVEEALAESRRNEGVAYVLRVRDNDLIATKPNRKRRQSVEEHTLRVAS